MRIDSYLSEQLHRTQHEMLCRMLNTAYNNESAFDKVQHHMREKTHDKRIALIRQLQQDITTLMKKLFYHIDFPY